MEKLLIVLELFKKVLILAAIIMGGLWVWNDINNKNAMSTLQNTLTNVNRVVAQLQALKDPKVDAILRGE